MLTVPTDNVADVNLYTKELERLKVRTIKKLWDSGGITKVVSSS